MWRLKSYKRSSEIFRKEKEKMSTAPRLKEERSIKPTLLYRAYSMLSRSDISGNWKFPVGKGEAERRTGAQVGREICLTVSRQITVPLFLFRVAPNGIGLRGWWEYSRRLRVIYYVIISSGNWIEITRTGRTRVYTRARTHICIHTCARVARREIDYPWIVV